MIFLLIGPKKERKMDTTKLGLQIVSDIHLEFRGKHVIYSDLLPRKAMDLALCGDIGRPFMEVKTTQTYTPIPLHGRLI